MDYSSGLYASRMAGKAEGIAEGTAKGIVEGTAKGKVEGIAEGTMKGIAEAKAEAARNMKADNIPLEKISQYTGLSPEEMEKL
jgi:predicted transposase/invertase (TIGR01784 family)